MFHIHKSIISKMIFLTLLALSLLGPEKACGPVTPTIEITSPTEGATINYCAATFSANFTNVAPEDIPFIVVKISGVEIGGDGSYNIAGSQVVITDFSLSNESLFFHACFLPLGNQRFSITIEDIGSTTNFVVKVLDRSCRTILEERGPVPDGIYRIDPDGDEAGEPMDVFCDMTTNGGGWTLAGYAYAGCTSTCDRNQNWHSLKCGGGNFNPTNRGQSSAAINATGLVKISTEVAFSMTTDGSQVQTGNIQSYQLGYKFTIPDPSKVHFKNHSYLGPNRGPGDEQYGPCVPVTVQGIHGTNWSGTKYTLRNVLGVTWTDSYPTGYGLADNTNCYNHDGGPFFTSIHSGHGNGSKIGRIVTECDVVEGSITYTHRGSYTHNSTNTTGSNAIWFR